MGSGVEATLGVERQLIPFPNPVQAFEPSGSGSDPELAAESKTQQSEYSRLVVPGMGKKWPLLFSYQEQYSQ